MKKLLLVIPFLMLTGCSKTNQSNQDADDATAFYRKYELSMEGYDLSKGSRLDGFIQCANRDNTSSTSFGDKIILSFVQEECALCEYQYPFIKDFVEQNNNISFYTVFVDSLNDNEDYIFEVIFERHQDFFTCAGETFYSSNFYKHLDKTYPQDWPESYQDFVTPLNFFFDFTDSAPSYTNKYGVSEVCFNFNSVDFINDLTNHTGVFGN